MADRLSGKRLHTAETFWGLVDISGGPASCWPWQGSVATTGYGQLSFHRRNTNAHRVAYTLWHGQEPWKGMHLDHLCRMPLCVNPAHLRMVTPRENTMAAGSLAPAKRNVEKTHCPSGHAYTLVNTLISRTYGTPKRHCRECGRIRVRTRRARVEAMGA